MNAMRGDPRKLQDEGAVEWPGTGAGRDQRANIESPADADANAAEAHLPRPHPPVEEPEEAPAEHAPEREPDRDPDADSDLRQRPPRPGKAPR